MEVLILQVFVSLLLGSILLFVFSVKQRDHEHSDRLALLPLESDEAQVKGPKRVKEELS